jgi:hypothetical protein
MYADVCIGLYGFSTATPIPLFPSLKLHYWASVLEVLRDHMGANVVVVGVKGYVCSRQRLSGPFFSGPQWCLALKAKSGLSAANLKLGRVR